MLLTLLYNIFIQLLATFFYINRKLINNIAINAITKSKHLFHYKFTKRFKNVMN